MKYRCTICGYVYDETQEGVPFSELPDTWQCPWCGAQKSAFEPVEEEPAVPTHDMEDAPVVSTNVSEQHDDMQRLTLGQMAALCSNLARGCEKQYMPEEMEKFQQLATWFTNAEPSISDATVEQVTAQLRQDIENYSQLQQTATAHGDRGALRVCAWGEKVTRMLNLLMNRYESEGEDLLANKEIWVCTVCGFVYIGEEAPELCPVCKVPAWKFHQIKRRKKS